MILSARGGKADIGIQFYIRQVCNRIKITREEKGVSQDAIGRDLGISGQAVGKIEKGSTDIRLSHLCKIADTLKTPLDRLLDIEPSDTIVIDLEKKVEQLQEKIRKMDETEKNDKLFIELLQKELKTK